MDQVYIPPKDYKVLVRCMTYNQSKYIEDALNSFAMQQTDFPFVCLVMDDCSTDGEQDVIKSWMERECDMENAEDLEIEKSFIALVPHKSNLNCQFAFYFLKENLYKKGGKAPMIAPWREYCEYEALCEGDDYWIDPTKLQKQVSWMDTHKKYSMCFTNAFFLDECKHIASLFNTTYIEDGDLTPQDAIAKWLVPTASILYRLEMNKRYPDQLAKIYSGDYSLILIMLAKGEIRYINAPMTVYRRSGFGMTSTINHKFAYQEQIRFLTSYNSYSQFRYDTIVKKRIKNLRDQVTFVEIRYEKKYYKVLCNLPFLLNKVMHHKNKV